MSDRKPEVIAERDIITRVGDELALPFKGVQAVIRLLEDGSTVPFIARYRKEATGSLDEVAVRNIQGKRETILNLEERRSAILKTLRERDVLTKALEHEIGKCRTLAELEALYAPFKRKQKTRADRARERGLEELAVVLANYDAASVRKAAVSFVDPEQDIPDVEAALQGAKDIVAEEIARDIELRRSIRQAVEKKSHLSTGAKKQKSAKSKSKSAKNDKDEKTKQEAAKYELYHDFSAPLHRLKPHQVLAIRRGEKEGFLTVKMGHDEEALLARIEQAIHFVNPLQEEAARNGLKRLLLPSLERELRSEITDAAEEHAIGVFAANLENLLLTPPLPGTRVLGLDPGIRTGSKCAVLDETGRYLDSFVINQKQEAESRTRLAEYIKRHQIELVAIGNGTGSHEVQRLVGELIEEQNLDLAFTVVAEEGASVYSASAIARKEFPDLDVSIRGAISIGRRLQDPLAELVKIDPASIGVGLYQHDLNKKRLGAALADTMESVVNRVGVKLNTASVPLLSCVSGITPKLAKSIVAYRNKSGMIHSREELKSITGMGENAYENCAGFLHIPESDDALDNSWVHPENYALARELKEEMKDNTLIAESVLQEQAEKHEAGLITVRGILQELEKPGRDPREVQEKPELRKKALTFEDLREGMAIRGTVRNVVDFGAFVDIGIKESALVHISELSDSFVRNPMDVLKAGDVREFRIISLDEARRRIGLSLRQV